MVPLQFPPAASDVPCGGQLPVAQDPGKPAEPVPVRAEACDYQASLWNTLDDHPLDADAHFIQGLVLLESGEPAAAAVALWRALCADARFALAAFTLGRAFDALGDTPAAYEQALRTLDPDDDRHERILQQIDPGDIATACQARLRSLREGS